MYTIAPLDTATWPAYADFVECHGAFGGCFCIGFHPKETDPQLAALTPREQKHARVVAGTTHHALVLKDGQLAGWCQFGSADELPRIKNRAQYDREATAAPDWRIACCYVGKGHRRQGVFAAALAGALDMIAELGGGVVEGYPESALSVPAGFLFHGALSTFEQLGFTRDRMIGKHRWVMTKRVEPAPHATI